MLRNRSISSAESPIPFFRYACTLPYSASICSLAAFRKSSLCNAGMSCLFRNGDYVQGDELEPLIEEALDAIEYALSILINKKRFKYSSASRFRLKSILSV